MIGGRGAWEYAPELKSFEVGSRGTRDMPPVKEIGPYRLFFYSSDGNEPPHIHVRRDRATAKFWLTPVRLSKSRRFNDHELRAIQKIVEENEQDIREAWNEHFGNRT